MGCGVGKTEWVFSGLGKTTEWSLHVREDLRPRKRIKEISTL